MNATQRAALRTPDLQAILDKCIADIMIEGVPRANALHIGSMSARMSKAEFEQYVMARISDLLRFH